MCYHDQKQKPLDRRTVSRYRTDMEGATNNMKLVLPLVLLLALVLVSLFMWTSSWFLLRDSFERFILTYCQAIPLLSSIGPVLQCFSCIDLSGIALIFTGDLASCHSDFHVTSVIHQGPFQSTKMKNYKHQKREIRRLIAKTSSSRL